MISFRPSHQIHWTKFACLLGIATFVGCVSTETASKQTPITLLVASSTRNAIEDIAKIYQEKDSSVNFRISSGSSNSLARQILAGAPADIFLSANLNWVETVNQAGMVETSIDLLTNRLVMVVPTGNPAGIQTPDDFLSERVERIAVAGKNVPAGVYAEQTLTNLGLFEKLHLNNKLVRGSDVRITLAYVERGEVDAGIVYATDARISPQVECVGEFDQHLYEPIVYPAVLLRQTHTSKQAQDFFEFLRSIEAGKIFQKYGFELAD